MIGQQLSHFKIVSKLGQGGMGEVYRAQDPKLGREVAIKVLPEALADDPTALARFEREARAVAALSHPNVLSIFDYGQQDGRVFAVMELLDGETLRERLERGSLPLRKGIELATRVAAGLAAAHDKGIVHRDLKPDNVFLTRDGQVKVLDFGLARVIPGTEGETLSMAAGTRPGTVLGTVGYMAPEQVRGEEADERSDIFSLGAILYESLSGRRAFRGDSPVETMSAILKEEPPELSLTGHEVPPGVDRVLRHCLEKNPAERFQSARDLAFDLEALADLSTTSRGRVGTGAPQRRGRVLRILGALALVAAVPLAYLKGRSGDPGRPSFEDVAILIHTAASPIVFNARFAPDGETILYSGTDSGNRPSVYRLRPSSIEPTPAAPEGAHLLSVSSQGDLALLLEPRFIGHRLFEGTLARLPAAGGAPREMLERVRDADWSPDGSQLAILRDESGVDRLEYPIGNLLLETDGYLSDLRVSPDGSRVAVLLHPQRWDNQGRLVILDRLGQRTETTAFSYAAEGVAWAPAGDEVYYARCHGATLGCEVTAVDLNGAQRVAYASSGLYMLDVGADGRWLTLEADENPAVLAGLPGREDEVDLGWGSWPTTPIISADGRRVAFCDQSIHGGRDYRVLMRSTEGSPVVDLGPGIPLDFSPDGQWVLAFRFEPLTLLLHPLGPGATRSVEISDLVDVSWAFFSPGGQDVIAEAGEPARPNRCFRIPLDGGASAPLTPEGTLDCAMTPDGQWIAARSTTDGSVAVYPMTGPGEPYQVPDWLPADQILRWSPGGDRLWAVRQRTNGGADVYEVEPRSGERRRLQTISPQGPGILASLYLDLADDPSAYTYSARGRSTRLLEITGLR